MNKLTGIAVFLIPFFLVTEYAAASCWAVCVVAAAASLEELAIHLGGRVYNPDRKSVLEKV